MIHSHRGGGAREGGRWGRALQVEETAQGAELRWGVAGRGNGARHRVEVGCCRARQRSEVMGRGDGARQKKFLKGSATRQGGAARRTL